MIPPLRQFGETNNTRRAGGYPCRPKRSRANRQGLGADHARLEALETVVADKFRNIKTISLARERAEKHQQHIKDKKETVENDILSLMRHVRKMP